MRKTIDSLKGIGILGVVLVHYSIKASNDLISGIVFNGARGVQLLFIINDYLIFTSLSKIQLNKTSILKWWKAKFIRLIPLYWFYTIIHLMVFGLGERYYLGTLPKVSILNILCNLSFLHGFHPYYINSINANWFMADLAIFYLFAPFLYKIINSLEKSILALLIVTPIGYILMHFALKLPILQVEGIWEDYVKILSFPSEFPIILLGIFAFFAYKEKNIRGKDVIAIVGLIFSCFCMISLFLKKDYFILFNNIFSFGFLLMIVFVSQMIKPLKLICNGFFAAIGKHSYGIYLSHIIILKYINMFLGEFRNEKIIDIIGYILLVLAAYIVSVLSENIIERNAIKLLNRREDNG